MESQPAATTTVSNMSTAVFFTMRDKIMGSTFNFSSCILHTNDILLRVLCVLAFYHLCVWKCVLPIRENEQDGWVERKGDCSSTAAFTLALSHTGCAGVRATCGTKRDARPAASSSRAAQSGNQSRVGRQTRENGAERGTEGRCKGGRVKRKVGQRHSEQVLPP